MASFSFLNEQNVFKRWESSEDYSEKLTEHFPELQRIARNRPLEGTDPDFPNVTDGTSASIVQKTPKRAVQQLPTGVIDMDEGEDYMPIVAQYVLENKIIPYANEDYSLFEKCHLVIEGGLTFGSVATYTPFLNHGGYYCPDLTIPYWGDVFIQKGKKSARTSDFVFLRSWWQPEDIEELIDSEKQLAKEDGYESTWDLKALEEVKKHLSEKVDQARTPHEEERTADVEAVELITAFQNGFKAKFYTFHADTKKIVRTKENKDPRGKMPIQWYFGDADGTNPLGRGIIELIGGLQNLIDSDMQMYQYNRALMLAPPVVKYGQLGNFQYKPNIVLETDDPNAKVVPLTVDTSAIANYPSLYGLQKSQLLNLVNSPDTSMSAELGNPGFSKTPTGIKAQQAMLSIDDNAVRKSFEAWFQDWAETAVNLYFAEKTGIEVISLDKETADKLRELAQEGKFDESMLNENNEIIFNYDDQEYNFRFKVDASTSRVEDKATQLEGLSLLQQFVDSSPTLQQLIPPEKLLEIYNGVVENSGVEDYSGLLIDIEQFIEQQQIAQMQAQEQQMQQQAMQQEMMAQQQAQPQEPQMQEQPQLSETDAQLVEQLRALGLPDEIIAEAMQMLDEGASDQEVMTAIGAYKELQNV